MPRRSPARWRPPARAPADVTLISPHGVGAGLLDRYEADALASVFGNGASEWPAFLPLKGAIGHTLGGCALVETVGALLALAAAEIPAAARAAELDPGLPLGRSFRALDAARLDALEMHQRVRRAERRHRATFGPERGLARCAELLRPLLIPMLRRAPDEVERAAQHFSVRSQAGRDLVAGVGRAFLGGYHAMLESADDRRGRRFGA